MAIERNSEGTFHIPGAHAGGAGRINETFDLISISGGPCRKGCCHDVSIIIASGGIMIGLKFNDQESADIIEAIHEARKDAKYSRAVSAEG